MKLATLFLPLSLLFMATFANAASIALTEEDCIEILERYAADPESVPQHLLDACKEMLGAIAPGAGDAQKPTADPCADPATANSVQCWGPWAALAPAAAGFKPTDLAAIDEFDTRPELAEEFTTQFQIPDLPLGECAAGAGCGFATLAPGLVAQPDNTSASKIVPFSLAADGSRFDLNPGDVVEDALQLTSLDGMQSPGFGNSRFRGESGDTGSTIIANVSNAANGELSAASGLWRHGSLTNQNDSNTNAGVFAWGIASSQNTLDLLNNGGQGKSVNFAGFMSGDTRTSASMVVNFGTQPNWTGSWQNADPRFSFDARGSVSGVNLISTGFSDNVAPDPANSYVQGILLGEEGSQSVAHAINITLKDGGVVKDVGTLRQLP